MSLESAAREFLIEPNWNKVLWLFVKQKSLITTFDSRF